MRFLRHFKDIQVRGKPDTYILDLKVPHKLFEMIVDRLAGEETKLEYSYTQSNYENKLVLRSYHKKLHGHLQHYGEHYVRHVLERILEEVYG